MTHPDGRLQRLRPAVPRPGGAADLAGAGRARGQARSRDRDRFHPRGARHDRRRGPVLRRNHARGDRRPRRPLAGAPSGFSVRGGAGGRRRGGKPRIERSAELGVGGRGSRPRGAACRRRPSSPAGDLPRPVGRRGDRAQPRAAVPDRRPDDRARPGRCRAARGRSGRRGRGALERVRRRGQGGAARADAPRRRLPDRGDRDRQRQRAQRC